MNRCTQLDELLHVHVPRRPLAPYWSSRSLVKGQGHMGVFVCAWCCIYPRTVLSLEQGLIVLYCLKTDRNRWTRFRPKTKPKTKVNIFVDYSVILRQHQQYSTISCRTFIAMSSLQRVQVLKQWSLLVYRPSEFRCFRCAFPPKTKTKTQHHFRPKTTVTETIKN